MVLVLANTKTTKRHKQTEYVAVECPIVPFRQVFGAPARRAGKTDFVLALLLSEALARVRGGAAAGPRAVHAVQRASGWSHARLQRARKC